jgi:hypothetical protein
MVAKVKLEKRPTRHRDEADHEPLPRKPGRGMTYEPSQEDRDLVCTLAGYGCPQKLIASLIKNPLTNAPIAQSTLREKFRDELELGLAKVAAKVSESLIAQVMKGNVTAAIWWEKTRLGYKEGTVVEHEGQEPVRVIINIPDNGRDPELTAKRAANGTVRIIPRDQISSEDADARAKRRSHLLGLSNHGSAGTLSYRSDPDSDDHSID